MVGDEGPLLRSIGVMFCEFGARAERMCAEEQHGDMIIQRALPWVYGNDLDQSPQ